MAGNSGNGTSNGKRRPFAPPWPGAIDREPPGPRDGAPIRGPLDVAAALRGKNILLIGTTGFVGKVALSMLLDSYPDVARVYCLVRPGAGNTADERFYKKVAASEAFDPLRTRYGDRFLAFLQSKIVAIPGDIGRPLCNITDDQFREFEQA